MKQVTIYTDGSALGNPGPGGYGAILRYGQHTREVSGGFRCTTNNRMEILATVEALKCLNEPYSSAFVASDALAQKLRLFHSTGRARSSDQNTQLLLRELPTTSDSGQKRK